MKKLLGLFVLATLLLTIGFASANGVVAAPYKGPCADLDLCQWKTVTGSPLLMPLGSPDTASCGLNYNTFWAVNTDTTAICVFDGTNLENTMLYLSIDNDVITCTLNNVEVVSYTSHENCAPVDPMNGYQVALTPQTGTNTLVCEVRDRGVMTHFDACVVGTPTPIVPEFGTMIGVLTVLGALGAFFVVRRK